ncbi:N-terminal GNAT family acetyltransferase [Legionella donaldsonii]|uniref:N-terminal GNAT family acetyltransferase n=1 Tax=Legionella donaldsonii TaxID=45060 RepID=A0A378JB90_9GAMM|nr:GNAT family N-acetyltransferase [Legionella donaldsonii]STX44729.1 N-terminal GNAT family acetyltransferase [Legionella donaldsonii]
MLICNNHVSDTQLSAIDDLAALCRAADGGVPPLYRHLLIEKRATDNNVFYYQDNHLAGFLSVYFFYEDACEISIIVDPTYRRQGIATQMLQSIMPLLLTKQINTVIFSTPAKLNDEWLSRLGFHYQSSEYHMQRHSYEPVLISRRELTMRPATAADIPILSVIDEACFEAAKETDMAARFNSLLNDNNYVIFLASLQEKPVGKAHIRWQSDDAILSDIAILPAYQRQGLGSELLAWCINNSLSQGKTHLALDVETSNQGALDLYTRHGFKTKDANDYWAISIDKLRTLS